MRWDLLALRKGVRRGVDVWVVVRACHCSGRAGGQRIEVGVFWQAFR